MGYMRDKTGRRLDGYEPARTSVSTIGTRIFGGRMATVDRSAAATCFQVTTELAQDFDAVRLVFANTNTAVSTRIVSVGATAAASKADLNNSGGTWASNTRPIQMAQAPYSNRIAYTVSDWLPVASIPRSDGGTRPLVTVRAYLTASTVVPMYGNGTDDFTNWATRSNGRIWAAREQAVDGISTPANFTSTTNLSQSPIVGIQYAARGRVVTVFAAGDSITEGRGTYLNQGFVMPAAEALSSPTGIAVEYGNIGWNGQTMADFAVRALDLLSSDVKPDVLVMPVGSPNDQASTLAAANIAAMRSQRAQVLAECQRAGVRPVLWTWLPTNAAVRPYGSTDALRVAYNAESLALAGRGVAIADTALAVSGTTTGGQVQMAAGSNDDGIHPNDTGNAALTAALQPILATELGAALASGGRGKLQPTQLPVFTTTTAANVLIGETGVWTYAGATAAAWNLAPIFPSPRKLDGQLYIVKVRDTAGPLTITAQTNQFMAGGAASTTLLLQPGESVILVNDGTYWMPIGLTAAVNRRVATSAAATLTLDRSGSVFVFTGTSATTWTLPAVSASTTGLSYVIKNRGSAAITLGVASSGNLYNTASTATITIAAGASATVFCDGTYWSVL